MLASTKATDRQTPATEFQTLKLLKKHYTSNPKSNNNAQQVQWLASEIIQVHENQRVVKPHVLTWAGLVLDNNSWIDLSEAPYTQADNKILQLKAYLLATRNVNLQEVWALSSGKTVLEHILFSPRIFLIEQPAVETLNEPDEALNEEPEVETPNETDDPYKPDTQLQQKTHEYTSKAEGPATQVGAAEASGGAFAGMLPDDPPANVVFSSTPHGNANFTNVVKEGTDLTKAPFPAFVGDKATDATDYAFARLPAMSMPEQEQEQQICVINIPIPWLLDMSFHDGDPTDAALVGAQKSSLGGITTDESGKVVVWNSVSSTDQSKTADRSSLIQLQYTPSNEIEILLKPYPAAIYEYVGTVSIPEGVTPIMVIKTGHSDAQTITIE